MDWITLVATSAVTAIGGTLVALRLAGFLSKTWIEHALRKEMAEHKNDLTQKTERLKTDLAIYAAQQNVGLTRIDEQRSAAVQDIWKDLQVWRERFAGIMALDREISPLTLIHDAGVQSGYLQNEAHALVRRIRHHEIFFDEDAYSTLLSCGVAIVQVSDRFFSSCSGEDQELADPGSVYDRAEEAISTLRLEVGSNVEDLRKALVRDARRIMRADRT